MKYLEQGINTIRLYLVEGDADLKQFKVLAQDTFVWNGISVSFGILGESHFIQFFDAGDKQFTEMCACVEASFEKEKSKLLATHRLIDKDEKAITFAWNNFSYTFNHMFLDYKRGVEFLADLRNAQKTGGVHYLQYEFPKSFFSFKRPVTEVFIKESPDSLYIRTIHTYPNDKLVAGTQTTFKWLSAL